MNMLSSRRGFLKAGSAVTGGLFVGFHLPTRAMKQPDRLLVSPEFNAYIQIRTDGKIIIAAQNPEVGQGVKTSLPMIVAEELDADWNQVEVVQSAIDASLFGNQVAGGSRSVPSRWQALREAGGKARSMLVSAAANEWGVGVESCSTANSFVRHDKSGKTLSYAQLAVKAAALPQPETVELKAVKDFRLLGKRVTGVDNLDIVTGQRLYGIDQKVNGMQYAVFEKCPATGGTVKSANLAHIKQLPGVSDAFIVEGNGTVDELSAGVAIVANSTWAAFSARKQLEVDWDESSAAKDSWSQAQLNAKQLAEQAGKVSAEFGDTEKALTHSEDTLEAFYSYPYISHAQMEPQNCTVDAQSDHCELWAPTQVPQYAQAAVAKLLELPKEAVTLHQIRAGGGFGRRLMSDFCCEAAFISRKVGTPIKLQWTREDDMAHDFYRVGGFHALKAGLNKQGKITAWQDHHIGFGDRDGKVMRGAQQFSDEFPVSKIENARLSQSLIKSQVPTGWWRAPISCSVAFAMQSFIHEIAVHAKRDHGEYLLELLLSEDINKDAIKFDGVRAADTVRTVLERASWGSKLAANHHQGLAFYYSHSGYFAHVAELSVDDNKKVSLHKVFVVGDVGPIVNMSGAENQVEGSVIDGFSTAMGLELSIENGRIEQSNYHQYPLLRMRNAPEIDVHFIQSDNPPTGLGEPALPPTAPAIANALFAATGERLRQMPFTKSGYSV